MTDPFGELVSIISPCYNSSKFISHAIESVLEQTYKNWELIIVDDGSTDNSIEIIKKYEHMDKRIKLIEFGKNSGPALARNRAINEAKGRYIAFLDSDDIWLPQKLEKQIAFMIENNIALTYSSYYLIDKNGNNRGVFITKKSATYNELLKTCFIGNLTAIYDADIIGKYFLENIGHGDYTLWLKILKKIAISRGIIEPLAKYRLSDKSFSANKIKAACWQWKIYSDIEKLGFFSSLYYFLNYIYFGYIKYRNNRML
jgi:glycosyltransferase involved in cell wall biosynthesis